MIEKLRFGTDTASIAIFDPKALEHRIKDTSDWWTDPYEEIDEINKGNLILVGLGQDGTYDVIIAFEEDISNQGVSALLKCISGKIFIGPGEEISADGYAPFQRPYTFGKYIELAVGTYKVAVNKNGFNVQIGLEKVDTQAENFLNEQLLV